MTRRIPWRVVSALAVVAALLLPVAAAAAPPVVKTVPWVAANPLIAHDTYAGKAVRLKGTADVQGAAIQYRWQFGDGSPDATGTVSNMYAIEAAHTYAGSVGDIFAATLTVTDVGTGEYGAATYLVQMRSRSLQVEANIAIDEGLWYLHKYFVRSSSGGKDYGSWIGGCAQPYACGGYQAQQGANVTAFFVNGHRVDGLASNPYTETVQRAMRTYFTIFSTGATSSKTFTGGSYGANLGTIDPDCTNCEVADPSKNGLYVWPNVGSTTYQMGMLITALAASGTPAQVADTGAAGIVGRTYRAILQDMVDWFVWGQEWRGASGCSGFGGWHYGAQYCTSDNSTAQWGAIGLLGAEGFGKGQYNGSYGYVNDPGIQVPEIVRMANPYWLNTTYYETGTGNMYGYFLYMAGYNPWSIWATTASGMVQLAFDRLGRGGADVKWEKTEKYLRDTLMNGVKDYYYGLYAFVKAMLLHVNETSGLKEPITLLDGDLDWYAAEVGAGAPTDGVARTLVNRQDPAGFWWGYSVGSGEQQYFHTSWAIQMLNRTITESGAPVAVAKAIPNPAIAGAQVTLDGSASFHQDPTKAIVKWDWDIGNDGSWDLTGPVVLWTAPAVLGNYQVKLRVTDNFGVGTTADTIITVEVSIPPLPPTANAGGPYHFCPGAKPWFLDGSKSVNPDEGQHQAGAPGDTIYGAPGQFSWNLGTAFGDAVGVKPSVTTYFEGKGVGSYLIQLKVTDTTATSFPASGQPDLSSTASGQVFVLAGTDPICAGCTTLSGRAAGRQVQLTWTATAGAAGYAVYRGTVNGGPYTRIAQVPAVQRMYIDANTVIGTTYYWIVRPLAANLDEICQSNQYSARIFGR